jgi:3-hydroxybutyryl-CoA dehydrogenase
MSVRTLGVIGTGTMGGGIAQAAATAGLQVIAVDVSEAALSSGLRRLTGALDRAVKKGTLDVRQRDAALAAIKMRTSYDALNEADIVIEAATENAELKTDIVKRVDQAVRATAVIASTTSSISITKLAALVTDPSRFIGMHFFNPVPAMNLVEIVRGLQTSDATSDFVTAFARQLGKTSIAVKNTPGFVVNRILIPMINEALFVLAEGDSSPEEIDQGMKLGCNHPMGPLALADLIGLDVLLSAMDVLHTDFADSKYRPCPLLREMVDAGYLGRKSGRGIYRY